MNIPLEHLKHIYTEDLFLVKEPEAVKDSYVDDVNPVEKTHTETGVSEPETVRYWGANEKGILFIAYDTDSEFLNKDDHEFLMKIIESGLRLGRQDIAVANCAKFPYRQIRDEVTHEYLVFFGDQKTLAPRSYGQYQIIKEDNVKMLYAESLKDIAGDRQKKRKLWNALKSMFNI